ncbi:MAG: hypothetical protein ABJO71_11255 [Pseudoruegeria sp.]
MKQFVADHDIVSVTIDGAHAAGAHHLLGAIAQVEEARATSDRVSKGRRVIGS